MGDRVDAQEQLRLLPAVDEVLRRPDVQALLGRLPRWAVVKAIRELIDELRVAIRDERGAVPPSQGDQASLAGSSRRRGVDTQAIEARALALVRPRIRRVLNATGVVLHTNLGRAPLPPKAVSRIQEVACHYSNLEYNLTTGERGSRHDHLGDLLTELAGAEAACVVNNNAAAVLLVLTALAAGREVIVSRGELVEIGGSFRLPDVMRLGGVRLREVGTTNRTHPDDYRQAIGPETALLLKVHPSNFAVVGFTASVPIRTLAAIGREAGIPTVVDVGSGCFVDLAAFGLPREPCVPECLREGADLCTFSGDKLLGGPQAGIICGKADLVALVKRHPLMRALRPDKITLAALEATLTLYRDGSEEEVPVMAMLGAREETLRDRAERLASAIVSALTKGGAAGRLRVEPCRTSSAVGGGALPLATPPSWAVALDVSGNAMAFEARLRTEDPPVVGRLVKDRILLDVRTLTDEELATVAATVARAASLEDDAATARRDKV